MMKTTMIFTIMLSILSIGGISQTYDRQYTVDYINSKSTEVCKLFFEKKNLRIEFYSNGAPVRIDYIFPESIDLENGITYSEDEGALVFSCYEKAGKCIEREILKHGSKLLYDRTNLKLDCTPEEGEAFVEAGRHLIQLYLDKKHTRDIPFDQQSE